MHRKVVRRFRVAPRCVRLEFPDVTRKLGAAVALETSPCVAVTLLCFSFQVAHSAVVVAVAGVD